VEVIDRLKGTCTVVVGKEVGVKVVVTFAKGTVPVVITLAGAVVRGMVIFGVMILGIDRVVVLKLLTLNDGRAVARGEMVVRPGDWVP